MGLSLKGNQNSLPFPRASRVESSLCLFEVCEPFPVLQPRNILRGGLEPPLGNVPWRWVVPGPSGSPGAWFLTAERRTR